MCGCERISAKVCLAGRAESLRARALFVVGFASRMLLIETFQLRLFCESSALRPSPTLPDGPIGIKAQREAAGRSVRGSDAPLPRLPTPRPQRHFCRSLRRAVPLQELLDC